jgi:tRNA(fMet)-specific endonuclease VapC
MRPEPLKEMAVIDTDVISYIFKEDTRAEAFDPYLDDHLPVLSFMTLAELELRALAHNWGVHRRRMLDAYLQQFVTYPYDPKLCKLWAVVMDGARRKGRPIHASDAWIAATALALGVPLVTHNRADFLGIDGLHLLSP